MSKTTLADIKRAGRLVRIAAGAPPRGEVGSAGLGAELTTAVQALGHRKQDVTILVHGQDAETVARWVELLTGLDEVAAVTSAAEGMHHRLHQIWMNCRQEGEER